MRGGGLWEGDAKHRRRRERARATPSPLLARDRLTFDASAAAPRSPYSTLGSSNCTDNLWRSNEVLPLIDFRFS